MLTPEIKNYVQKKKEHFEYDPVSKKKKIRDEQNGNLERHEASKDRGSCALPKVPKIRDTAKKKKKKKVHSSYTSLALMI